MYKLFLNRVCVFLIFYYILTLLMQKSDFRQFDGVTCLSLFASASEISERFCNNASTPVSASEIFCSIRRVYVRVPRLSSRGGVKGVTMCRRAYVDNVVWIIYPNGIKFKYFICGLISRVCGVQFIYGHFSSRPAGSVCRPQSPDDINATMRERVFLSGRDGFLETWDKLGSRRHVWK